MNKKNKPVNRRPRNLAEWQTYLAPHFINIKHYLPRKGADNSELEIVCMLCGAEEKVPAANLVRRKKTNLCKNCGSRQDYTTDNIRKVIEEHGGKLLAGEVTNKESLVRARCACGAEQNKRAQDVRRRPGSCDSCRGERIRLTTLTNNENLQTARKIAAERGGRCLTGTELISVTDKIKWECGLGHIWEACLDSVKTQGTWCPTCNFKFGENLTRALMEAAFGAEFKAQKPDFLNGLELDGYNADLGLAFEVHGHQHYQYSRMFHRSKADLYAQIERDVIKQLRCHRENVTLVTVPYFILDEGIKAVRPFLAQALETAGFKPPQDITTIEIDMSTIFDMRSDPKYKDFARIVQERGGSFSDQDYQGRTRPIPVTCEKGHTWNARPYLVIKGHWCPHCVNNAVKNLDDIENALKKKGWGLIEKPDYKNAHQPLPMQCPSGHPIDRSWNDWEQGNQGCSICKKLAEARKFSVIMWLRGILVDLDDADYQNARQEVEGRCTICSGISKMTIHQWKHIQTCSHCGMALPPYFKHKVEEIEQQKFDSKTKN